jgi:hypothetical protein
MSVNRKASRVKRYQAPIAVVLPVQARGGALANGMKYVTAMAQYLKQVSIGNLTQCHSLCCSMWSETPRLYAVTFHPEKIDDLKEATGANRGECSRMFLVMYSTRAVLFLRISLYNYKV